MTLAGDARGGAAVVAPSRRAKHVRKMNRTLPLKNFVEACQFKRLKTRWADHQVQPITTIQQFQNHRTTFQCPTSRLALQ